MWKSHTEMQEPIDVCGLCKRIATESAFLQNMTAKELRAALKAKERKP